MTADERARGTAVGADSDDLAELVSAIAGVVERFRALEGEARELGIFLHDRELLTCHECGLMEDVLVDGRLVTYRRKITGQDTGLRFVEDEQRPERFTCPACGCSIMLEDDDMDP